MVKGIIMVFPKKTGEKNPWHYIFWTQPVGREDFFEFKLIEKKRTSRLM